MSVPRLLVAGLTSGLLVLGSGVGVAHDGVVTAKATISRTQQGFKGKVVTTSKDCKKRKITLFRASKGGAHKVAKAKSNKKGKWSVKVPGASGKYFVKVAKKTVSRYLHVHRCKAAKSPSVRA
ncbi:MAG: hypothetical protein JJE05_05160 [Actinobacteria bacterium]|nr:hypothetical protein [Actinomycetota bacterium]